MDMGIESVQNLPAGPVNFDSLAWEETSHRTILPCSDGENNMPVREAFIAWDRVQDFITGEEARCADLLAC